MRQVRFPPFGFDISEFGLGEPFKTLFSPFFYFSETSVFEIRGQKDAPGSISPLRARIDGVWAPGASWLPIFGVFRFAEKLKSVFCGTASNSENNSLASNCGIGTSEINSGDA